MTVTRPRFLAHVAGACLLVAGCGSGSPPAADPYEAPTQLAPSTTAFGSVVSSTTTALTDNSATPTTTPSPTTAASSTAAQPEFQVEGEASADEAREPDATAPPSTMARSGDVESSLFPPVDDAAGVARWTVEIVETVPHDPDAFTQGLEVVDGTMYESTGLWGRSSLRAVDPATGEVTTRVDLPDELFGEGLTVVGDEIVQLTWQSGTALVYDRASLELLREHSYEGEGWGLCEMDGELIMTDGSNRLARRHPQTFEMLGAVTVTAPGYDGRLDRLNELECLNGAVIANVWQTDRLLVIDPATGRVAAVIDAGPLVEDAAAASSASDIDVLNGVAFDGDTATLWMTGKLWPRLYRVRIVAEQAGGEP